MANENPYTHITHRLPDEVLSQVFLSCAEDCRVEYENARWDDYTHRPYRWLTVTHVCGHWREVALRCSVLWNWIVPMRRAATRAFLQRSGERPLIVLNRRMPQPSRLDITPDDCHDCFPLNDDDEAQDALTDGALDRREMTRALRLVYRSFSRIERLDVFADYPPPPGKLWPPVAPKMRNLTIRSRTWMDGPMLEMLETVQYPALTSFQSWINPLHIRSFIRPTLTSLTLSARDMRNAEKFKKAEQPSVAQCRAVILNLLECVPALQQLRIDYTHLLFEHDYSQDAGSELPPPERKIEFRHMRHVRLLDRAGGFCAATLLQYFDVPSATVSVRIESCSGSPSPVVWAQMMATVNHLWATDIPLAASVHSTDPDSNLSLELWDSGAQLQTFTPYAHWGTPRVLYWIQWNSRWNYNTAHTLAETFASWIPVERLSTFSINVRLDDAKWRKIFARAENLTQLHIRGQGVWHITKFLLPADGGLEPRSEANEASDSKLLFPKLNTVVFEETYWKYPPRACLPTSPERFAPAIAATLVAHGGLRQVVVRRGIFLVQDDVQRLVDARVAPDIDWDGAVDNQP